MSVLEDKTDLSEQIDNAPDLTASEPSAAHVAALSATALALAACGGGGGGGSPLAPPPPPPPPTQTQAARFLLQAQFSAPDADIAAVISQGYAGWLSAQFSAPVGQGAAAWLTAHGYNAIDTNQYFFNSGLADRAIWNQLITDSDQVRRRLTLALSEMFVVSINGIASETWPAYLAAHFWDVLASNVFGNFRTLLEAVTLNPAMGVYLNTKGNLKENTAKGRLPDENYAREVMQLFTIGLYELNDDGSLRIDLSGNKTETYTQNDISNLARVFTGYDLDKRQTVITPIVINSKTRNVPDTAYTGLPMYNSGTNHSTLAATFLGTTIAADTLPLDALKIALDTLFNHHNVGPFFARQMIQRLVTSSPSAAYVTRVTKMFNNNGSGVRGDLKAVWLAILTDPEALSLPTSNTAGRVREPMIRLAQLMRTLNVTSTSGNWLLSDLSDPGTEIGQSPLRAPSVFNFFRPGYVPPGTALATQNITAPEFQIINETSIAGYLNFLANFLKSGYAGDVKLDYTTPLTFITNTQGLIDWLNLRLCANQLSPTTQATIKTALDAQNVTATSSDTVKNDLISLAIYLCMASTDYLIQK